MRLDRTDVANLRAAGLTVVELDGWLTSGRPGTHDPMGILCHHTAATQDGIGYAKWMADVGRADLPAPLAQIGLDREGVVYMQAAGRANHAGRCKIIRPWLTPYPGYTYGDGNAQMVGVEAMNTGTEGWSATQKHAYVTVCAVLCRRRGWDAQHVLGHKETSLEGKPDPSFDMNTHRAQVAAALDQEDDMLPADLLNAPAGVNPADQKSPVDVGDRIAIASNYAYYTWVIVRQLAAKSGVDVDEQALAAEILASLTPVLREAVATAVSAGGSPDQIADAVVAKFGATLTAKE